MAVALLTTSKVQAGFTDQAPVFRGSLGVETITINIGQKAVNEPLASLVTLRPAVLWDFPTFNSRLGTHYIGVFGSRFGSLPISGIGFSGYFYPLGLSTAYEITRDQTLFQKSKPGPFVVGMFTPVNLSVNLEELTGQPTDAVSAFMLDFAAGAGYDYPLNQNMILSAELMYRTARAQQSNTDTEVGYSGFGINLTFSTSYY